MSADKPARSPAPARIAPLDAAATEAVRLQVEALAQSLPRGCSAVAERVGESRAALSMFLRGVYPANAGRLAARIQAALAGGVPAAAPAARPGAAAAVDATAPRLQPLDEDGTTAARQSLAQAVRDHARGLTGVADTLGLSVTALRQFLAGNYPARTGMLAARIRRGLEGWTCPHTQLRIYPEQCRETALAKAPTHRPDRMAQWGACQRCPHRPQPAAAPAPNNAPAAAAAPAAPGQEDS